MNDTWRFRRNLFLIALAHLIAVGLIFYFGRERNAGGGGGGREKVTWVDPADFAKNDASSSDITPPPTPEPTPVSTPEPTTPEPTPPPATPPPSDEGLNLSTPTPTPKPTATPKPKPSVTPAPKKSPSPTPKKSPSPTPKKSPSPTPKKKPTPTNDDVKPTKSPSPAATKKPAADDAETAAKKAAAVKALRGDSGTVDSNSDENPSDSTGKGPGSGGGEGSGDGTGKGTGSGPGTDPGLLTAYNQVIKMKCDAWEQPISQVKADYKFTTTMTLTISKAGTLESFAVKNPSGNEIVDESVKAFLGTIKRFPAPPTGKEYVVNINFELGGE